MAELKISVQELSARPKIYNSYFTLLHYPGFAINTGFLISR